MKTGQFSSGKIAPFLFQIQLSASNPLFLTLSVFQHRFLQFEHLRETVIVVFNFSQVF